MPQQRMDIRMIKDILRLKYSGGLSQEAIARNLSISKGVVTKYLGLAGAAGLNWEATAELDEASLERRLLGRSSAETAVVPADSVPSTFVAPLTVPTPASVPLAPTVTGDCNEPFTVNVPAVTVVGPE